jgi:hypothetical protein
MIRKNEECLLVSLLQRISSIPSSSEVSAPSMEEGTGRSSLILGREGEVQECLKTSTPEDLALEIISFRNTESLEKGLDFHGVSNYYWSSKGVHRYFLPDEIMAKMQKAEFLAEKEIRKQGKRQTPIIGQSMCGLG